MSMNTDVFVSNFPFTTTEDDLKFLFEDCGAVKSVRILMDRETRRSRGFGFVTFERPQDAEEAIRRYHGSEIGGRPLKVEVATRRSSQRVA